MRFTIDWASLIVGRKFAVFCFVEQPLRELSLNERYNLTNRLNGLATGISFGARKLQRFSWR